MGRNLLIRLYFRADRGGDAAPTGHCGLVQIAVGRAASWACADRGGDAAPTGHGRFVQITVGRAAT